MGVLNNSQPGPLTIACWKCNKLAGVPCGETGYSSLGVACPNRVAAWRETRKLQDQELWRQVKEVAATGYVLKKPTDLYRIEVAADGEQSRICFFSDNTPLVKWINNRMLWAEDLLQADAMKARLDAEAKEKVVALLTKDADANQRQWERLRMFVQTPPTTEPIPPDGPTDPPVENECLAEPPNYWLSMFDRQLQLMYLLQIHPSQLAFSRPGRREEIGEKAAMAMITESVEVLNEFPWKSWKQNGPVDKVKLAEELADVMAYVIEIAGVTSISPEELFHAFIAKNQKNIDKIQLHFKEAA